MSILALDYGDKHLGLAISSDGKISSVYGTVSSGSSIELLKKVQNIIETENVSLVVVGLPISIEGKLTRQAIKICEFGQRLKKHAGVRVKYVNEILTSHEAVKKMLAAGVPKGKRKELEHQFAAQIILEDYLKTQNE